MANLSIKQVLTNLGKDILNWVKSNCVNNLVSDATNLPLSAAQGKVLQDQITTLNSNLEGKILPRLINVNSGESVTTPTNNHTNLIFCRSSNSNGGFIGSIDTGATYYYIISGTINDKITITPNKDGTYTISNNVGWMLQFIIL